MSGEHSVKKPKKHGNSSASAVFTVLLLVLIFVLYKNATVIPISTVENLTPEPGVSDTADILSPAIGTDEPNSDSNAVLVNPVGNEDVSAITEPTPEPTPTPLPEFTPEATENTLPENLIAVTGIQVDGETLSDQSEYESPYEIDFATGDEYTDVEGIITFRGNNFRDTASYGYANLTEYSFGDSWYVTTGSTYHDGSVWTGSGWVGQPLIVRWPDETKQVMNMYESAKQKEGLVEVIYATMDGYVYFLDLETGEPTRDKLHLGYTFKGAGALDPRGYPILYLGAGFDSDLGISRVFIISLIDFSIMYTFGNMDSFSRRGELCYFDSSPLVDAETDQLIYPGENGIIYIIHLNSEYDEKAGTVSIAPDRVVKWNYYGTRSNLQHFWVGMEDSAVIWRSHLIIADNGGNLMCLNLNTLQLVWVADVLDDTNGTPVLSIEDGHPYIYIGTSFHYGWRSYYTVSTPIWKIDAINGETVWKKEFTCRTQDGVSGGIQSTVALGKNDLEGYIYITVAMTDAYYGGRMLCIDRDSGEIIWEHDGYYTWSSPVLLYNEDGSGCVLYCNYNNQMFLIDGKTGEVYDTFNLEGGVEASPAVFENHVVVGTRKQKIWGVTIK